MLAGKELVSWLQLKLEMECEYEALHLADMLCKLGYIVPVNEKQLAVRLDICCRIQVNRIQTMVYTNK